MENLLQHQGVDEEKKQTTKKDKRNSRPNPFAIVYEFFKVIKAGID